MTALYRSGSKVASISSFNCSNIITLPRVMASFRFIIQPLVSKVIIDRSSPQWPLIHWIPYNWGSINSGQRVQEQMTAAFSKDIGSLGRSSLAHWATSAELVRISKGTTPSVIGIFNSAILGCHMSFHSLRRNGAEKAGMYDTKAAARSTSPTIKVWDCFRTTTLFPHLTFSLARPLTSCSALLSLFWQALASASTFSFFSTAA